MSGGGGEAGREAGRAELSGAVQDSVISVVSPLSCCATLIYLLLISCFMFLIIGLIESVRENKDPAPLKKGLKNYFSTVMFPWRYRANIRVSCTLRRGFDYLRD